MKVNQLSQKLNLSILLRLVLLIILVVLYDIIFDANKIIMIFAISVLSLFIFGTLFVWITTTKFEQYLVIDESGVTKKMWYGKVYKYSYEEKIRIQYKDNNTIRTITLYKGKVPTILISDNYDIPILEIKELIDQYKTK